MSRALVVEDERDTRELLVELVAGESFEVEGAATLAQAGAILAAGEVDLLLLDVSLPDGDGTSLLGPGGFEGDVIVITGHASVQSALEALRAGAIDYVVKPVDVQRLRTMLRHLARLHAETGATVPSRALGHFGQLVGISEPMQRVYDRLGRIAPTDASVLITGETGTGKELAARALHELSARRAGPFVALNCGAVPENLIESELFGHERGAFSGATQRHHGHFERADGGTLFLDEITEMPLALQVKLLRVLETGRVLRLGGEREITVDVRTLAATNREPTRAVSEARLREDLLYRLRVFQVEMPALRERQRDIDLLASHFLAELDAAAGTDKQISGRAHALLRSYGWPGNVRELRNALYSAHVLADREIDVDALPPELRGETPPATDDADDLGVLVGMSVAEAERRLIEATLEAVGGNRRDAAAMLGVSVKTLYNRLKAYGSES